MIRLAISLTVMLAIGIAFSMLMEGLAAGYEHGRESLSQWRWDRAHHPDALKRQEVRRIRRVEDEYRRSVDRIQRAARK